LIDKFLITATVCHPLFKTAWIKNDIKKQLTSEYLKSSCYELNNNDNDNNDVEDNQINDNFLAFLLGHKIPERKNQQLVMKSIDFWAHLQQRH